MLSRRVLAGSISFLLLVNIAINLTDCVWIMQSREFNVDEFQHAHIIWNLVQGKIIYRDFFEHHGPLFPYLNSLIFKVFRYAPGTESLHLLRLHNLIVIAVLLLLVFMITQLLTHSFLWGLFSASFLSSLSIFKDPAIEIRPDTLQNLLFLLGVYIFLKYTKKASQSVLFLSGITIGFSILANSKAGMGILGFIIFMCVHAVITKDVKRLVHELILFLSGACVPLLVTICYFFYQNGLYAYLYYNFIFNFRALPILATSTAIVPALKTFLIQNHAIFDQRIFFLLEAVGLSALLYSAYGMFHTKNYDRRLLFLLIMTLVSTSLLCFGVFYKQIVLSVLPMVCIAVTFGLYSICLQKKITLRTPCPPVAALLVILIVAESVSTCISMSRYPQKDWLLATQESSIDYVIHNVARSEPIPSFWTLGGDYVFNADLQYYWYSISFVKLIDIIEDRDVFGADLIRLMEARHVRYVEIDNMDKDSKGILRKYLQEHFQHTPIYSLLERKSFNAPVSPLSP